ncbi:MAG: hemerythrin domain-containing protein [Acidimicrobiales bacterium]
MSFDSADSWDPNSANGAWSSSAAVKEFTATHRMIRRLSAMLRSAVQATGHEDGSARTRTLAKAMQFTVDGIRFHHALEDREYWPAIVANGADESELKPLMTEHEELDPIIDQLEDRTQRLLKNPSDADAIDSSKELFGVFADHISVHLDHEEPIFFPLLGKYLTDDEAKRIHKRVAKDAPRKGVSWLMGGVTYAMTPEEATEFLAALPKPITWLRPLLLQRFKRNCTALGVDPASMSAR